MKARWIVALSVVGTLVVLFVVLAVVGAFTSGPTASTRPPVARADVAACAALASAENGPELTHIAVVNVVTSGEAASNAAYRNWSFDLEQALNANDDSEIQRAIDQMNALCRRWAGG